MPVTTKIGVAGMSCDHCVAAVNGEVRKLGGVTEVDVDLTAGTVEIQSSDALDPVELNAAIDEAGFEITS